MKLLNNIECNVWKVSWVWGCCVHKECRVNLYCMFLIFPLIKAFLNKICMSSFQAVKWRSGPYSRVNDCLILFCLLPVLMLFFEVNSNYNVLEFGLFSWRSFQWRPVLCEWQIVEWGGGAVDPHSDMWEVVYRLLVCQAVKMQKVEEIFSYVSVSNSKSILNRGNAFRTIRAHKCISVEGLLVKIRCYANIYILKTLGKAG